MFNRIILNLLFLQIIPSLLLIIDFTSPLHGLTLTYLTYINFYLACAAGDIPYTNAMIAASNTATAPYFVGETITSECQPNFHKNPPDAPFSCMCSMGDTNVMWTCNPTSATVCQPGKYSICLGQILLHELQKLTCLCHIL